MGTSLSLPRQVPREQSSIGSSSSSVSFLAHTFGARTHALLFHQTHTGFRTLKLQLGKTLLSGGIQLVYHPLSALEDRAPILHRQEADRGRPAVNNLIVATMNP